MSQSSVRQSKTALRLKLRAKRQDPQGRSRRYRQLAATINSAESHNLGEAIALAKSSATLKFDSSMELHIHFKPKKGKKGANDDVMRGFLKLPHGLGKPRRVVVLDEAMIEEIAQTGKFDFDVALATPALMPKLARIAKMLGTKGKMPSPKSGTVTDQPLIVKGEIDAGRVEYRQDDGGNIHQMIGKASWPLDHLTENAQAVIKAVPANRIASVFVTSTMGPAAKVEALST